MKYIVCSYVSIETVVEADSVEEAIDQASNKIHEGISPVGDYNFYNKAHIFDEKFDKIDSDAVPVATK